MQSQFLPQVPQKIAEKVAEWNRKSRRFEITNSKSQCVLPAFKTPEEQVEDAQILVSNKSRVFLGVRFQIATFPRFD